jgi:hypothetical protein
MKNKGLLIGGGVAIVALGAFLWMRKKNQMAKENDETASENSTSETGKKEDKPLGKPIGTTGIGAAVNSIIQGSGATASSTPMVLTSKPINGVQDLDGTKLGLDISSSIVNNDARLKIQSAIVNMTGGERQVLNYIAVVDYPTRTSQSFKDAISSLLGANASSLVDSVYNKLLSASRFVPIATNQGAVGQLRDCRQEARARGIRDVEFRQMYNYIKRCKEEGGFDSGFDGSYSFNAKDFDTDSEDFAFNGHTF